TAVDRHVLVSTTYSKSVLRVAAQQLTESLDGVHYFPSYEIVTGNFSRGAYFADDLRSILEPGVEHVMSLFFRHATVAGGAATETVGLVTARAARGSVHVEEAMHLATTPVIVTGFEATSFRVQPLPLPRASVTTTATVVSPVAVALTAGALMAIFPALNFRWM